MTDKTSNIRTNMIFVLFILLVVDLAIALSALYRNYRTLRQTAEIFGDIHNKKPFSDVNMTYIYNAAKDAVEREHTMQSKLQASLPILNENLVKHILSGYESPSRLDELGLESNSSVYCVGIIDPTFEGSFRILSVAMKELLNDLFGSSIVCAADDEKNTIFFILTSCDQNIYEQVFQSIESKLECKMRVFISAPFDSVDNIPRIFKQLLLLYSRGAISDSVYVYGVQQPGFRFFDYSIELENQLINRIRTGDVECTKSLLNEIISRNAGNDHVTNEYFKNSLVDTAISIYNELDKRCISDQKLSELLNEFLIEKSISEDETYKLFIYMAELFAQNSLKSGSISSRAAEYVKNNFTDINCSVSIIASVMNLNTSYLSSMFKQQTGENLSDYIAGKRVEFAKELLMKHPEMSVVQIAEKSGFASETVLTRTFKKFTGVTPGKFRTLTKSIL